MSLITREDAIKIFNTVLFFNKCDCPKEEIEECLKMAIKALEQEPCEDAISREAVLMEIDKYLCGVPFGEKGINVVLKELPPVTLKARWIPVGERLPKDGTYLVTTEGRFNEPVIDMRSFAKDLNKIDDFNFPAHKCGWYYRDEEYGPTEDTEVVAWMPLPEPYKVESEVSDADSD